VYATSWMFVDIFEIGFFTLKYLRLLEYYYKWLQWKMT